MCSLSNVISQFHSEQGRKSQPIYEFVFSSNQITTQSEEDRLSATEQANHIMPKPNRVPNLFYGPYEIFWYIGQNERSGSSRKK